MRLLEHTNDMALPFFFLGLLLLGFGFSHSLIFLLRAFELSSYIIREGALRWGSPTSLGFC